jgi:UDP-N-acetylmuramoyl-tripeptide--D-alanyl-D-alanine ligase
VGFAAGAQYRIGEVELDGRLRPSFRLRGARFRIPLHGGHHVMNAAMAAAVAHEVFGRSLDEISVELAGASTGKWRMELLETDDAITILNDAYNANPTSMEAALVALAGLPLPGRRVAVLGDMRELGPHHDEAHRAIGVRAAGLGLDVIIGVGNGGAVIAESARTRGARVEIVDDAAAALESVDALVDRGDAVLCKASRAVGLEVVADGLLARHRRPPSDGSNAT